MSEEQQQPSFSVRRFLTVLLYFLILLAVIFGLFYLLRSTVFTSNSEKERQSAEASHPTVRIMIAEPESQNVELTLPSFLVAYNVTPVLARINGYLKNFYVDIGDYVKEGQLLCEIETPDVDTQIPPLVANLESLKAKLEIAKITAERWQRLYRQDPDAISKEEVDQTAAAYQSAIADVQAAQGQIEQLKAVQNFKNVYAPFDGVIVERNIDIGSLISVGNQNLTQPYVTGFEVLTQPLFKISSTQLLRAFVEVPQPYYPYVKNGVAAEVIIPEHPDKVFSGVINRNASALDQLARTLLTQVNIENKENLLRPGLFASVKFSFAPYADNFNLPIGALIIRNGPPFVALLNEGNTVHMQQVQIGRDFGKSVQIIRGLKKGDKIILNPNFKIKNGVKVKVVD